MPPGNICAVASCSSKDKEENVSSFTLPSTGGKDASVTLSNPHASYAPSETLSSTQVNQQTLVTLPNTQTKETCLIVPDAPIESSSTLNSESRKETATTLAPTVPQTIADISEVEVSEDRVSNLEAVLTNMLACGVLTDYMYHSDGNFLVQLWRATDVDQSVNILRYGFKCEDSVGFNKMPLQLTKPAPQFKTTAVVNGEFKDISLSDYKGKYVVLFFYPLDFTFVCPTEIIAFSERADDFRKIGCEVIAASTDSHFTHLAWINTPRKQGGLGPMNIPIISDKSHRIARDYGVLDEETGIPFRGLFIIDDNQRLRQITVNDLPVGRSVEETLRLVQAFQYTDKYGEVCPANWTPGSKTIKPDTKAAKEYFGDAN